MFDVIQKDMITAMKEHDKETTQVLKMVKAAIDKERIDKKCPITDAMVLDILLKQVKMREDSLKDFQRAKRLDLITATERELTILKKYLPAPLKEEEIMEIIDHAILSIQPTSLQDMGKVMALVTPLVKGRADLKEISVKIRQRLN